MCIRSTCISKREEKRLNQRIPPMPNPQFMEEKQLSLLDVKSILDKTEKRDTTLNYLSGKSKEYVEGFVTFSPAKKEELQRKLAELQLTRLKEEHIAKIIDFLPKTLAELKIVLLAYPLSMPKKDQESLVQAVQEAAS